MTSNRRNWIWFFVVLAVLSAAAVSINWTYKLRQRLTRQQLMAASDLWDKAGPADYDLKVRREIHSATSEQPVRDEYEVEVRSKRVVNARLNGLPLESRLWPDYDVPSWFDAMERFMIMDEQAGAPKAWAEGVFDETNGMPMRYVHQVSATRNRVEIQWTMNRVKPATTNLEK